MSAVIHAFRAPRARTAVPVAPAFLDHAEPGDAWPEASGARALKANGAGALPVAGAAGRGDAATAACRVTSLRDPEALPAGALRQTLPAAQFYDGIAWGALRDEPVCPAVALDPLGSWA